MGPRERLLLSIAAVLAVAAPHASDALRAALDPRCHPRVNEDRTDQPGLRDALEAYGERNAHEFAGIDIRDRSCGGRFYVGFTGHLDVHVASLRALTSSPDLIRGFAATFTERQLDDAQARLSDAWEALRADGILIWSFWADTPLNRLMVNIDGPPSDATVARIEALVGSGIANLTFNATPDVLH